MPLAAVELLLGLLSVSNSVSLSSEEKRSPQLACQGLASLASELFFGVLGAKED